MDIKLEHIRQMIGKLADYHEKDAIKNVKVELKEANPGDGIPTDILSFTVEFKRKKHGNATPETVTRVVEIFPCSDGQPVKVTEVHHYDVTEESK